MSDHHPRRFTVSRAGRLLLAGCVLAAIAFGLIAWSRSRSAPRFVRQVERLGGKVERDAAGRVTVDLQGTAVTDAELVHLAGLAKLWHLSVDGTQVTDAGLKKLKRSLPLLRTGRAPIPPIPPRPHAPRGRSKARKKREDISGKSQRITYQ